ncbi:MAG: prolipoprotein diacylglyceryl transferase [Spiroplasma sp.]|nr:prolipoprotein diacylglyceryl transferase [Spiroplasma sp.]
MMLFSDFSGPWGISSDYGWFHVYAFTMMFGMALAVFASWYKFHRAEIPADGLAWSVIFIIPASLFGASWFAKNDPLAPIGFWEKFAFWNPGLSIHGGVLFGSIAGLIFFGFYKKKTKISLFTYADLIIPNVLLGQVVGRWGNFFNHELLGEVVGLSPTLDGSAIAAINWLPAFIRDNCFKLVAGGPETLNGMYVFRAPIFLYESLANLGFWVILTFLLPQTFHWFSKKPWQIEAQKYKLLTFTNVLDERINQASTLTANKKASKHQNFNHKAMIFFDQSKSKTYRFNDKFNFIIKNPIKSLNLYSTLNSRNRKLKRKYWNQAFYFYKPNQFVINKLNDDYQAKKITYHARSKELYHLNNPKNYLVMRSGVQTWLYFFGWNLIRFCLELQRADQNLFIVNRRALDYAVLISIFVLGLIFAILSQLVFAKYNRNSGWTYEKEY